MPSGAAVAPYPGGSPASPASTPPQVIQPAAIASPKSVAVHDFGQVLKHLISNSHVFSTENAVDAALNVVDAFTSAFIPGAELPALLTGAERAMKEDVTKRIPPGGPMQTVMAGPVIDYRQLAQAILAEQKRLQLESGEGNTQS